MHCERAPAKRVTPGLPDLRVFDWLDDRLGHQEDRA
jgi:hypothetical protein